MVLRVIEICRRRVCEAGAPQARRNWWVRRRCSARVRARAFTFVGCVLRLPRVEESPTTGWLARSTRNGEREDPTMPSRNLGSLALAAAIALVAALVLFARDETGVWRVPFSSPKSAAKPVHLAGADGGNKKKKPRAAASKPTKPAAVATAKATLSKEVKDAATGLVLPRTKRFPPSKADLTCLGVGVRAKSIAVAKVNVYTVGLYVDPKGARGALKKYAGSDPASLSKDKSVFKVLGQAGGFSKYLHLVFARSVGAQKVVDALTSVKGVGQDVLDRFSSVMLDAVGASIGKGESVTLGWEGKDKMVILVRDKAAGTVVDAALPKAVFDLYLGSSPVSPAAKAAFAEGVPAFLAS